MIKRKQHPWFFLFGILCLTVTQAYAEALSLSKMNPAMAAVGEFGASTNDDPSLKHPHELYFYGGDLDLYASVAKLPIRMQLFLSIRCAISAERLSWPSAC